MSAARTITVRALAKINLALQVTGVRRDGYHELRTIFQSVSLHDTLTFSRARGPFEIECTDPACPADRTNLVWKAAEAVWRAGKWRGAPRDLHVRIEKRIPVQSGLGGGSSDAAAAIRACAALWKVRLDRERLHEIAATLGADVPYFLEGGTVLGLGRGDTLFPLTDRPAAWVTIVIPPFGVSTKDAFKWWDRKNTRPGKSDRSGGSGRSDVGSALRRTVDNDLEPAVAAHHPEITRLVSALKRLGAAHGGMSGSGSAVFGLFDSQRRAEAASTALDRRGQAIVARTCDRNTYRRLSRPR
jgi:4-diphosphocytidyl-2-C-methyl-D-erythritol kinase